MELLTIPTLRELIRMEITSKSEFLCARIFSLLISAIEYLHLNGVCHRDLKPSNVFVTKDGLSLKIIDFGTAVYYRSTDGMSCKGKGDRKELWSPSGTDNYKSPEQIGGRTNEKTDVYAAGLILYEMVTRKKPFGRKK